MKNFDLSKFFWHYNKTDIFLLKNLLSLYCSILQTIQLCLLQAMMDRERKDELPQMQVGFIDVICLPLYRVLSDTFPWMKPLYQGTLENRKHWQDLAEKVEMGLTWIDHDTIDKPVEAFTGIKKYLKIHKIFIKLSLLTVDNN